MLLQNYSNLENISHFWSWAWPISVWSLSNLKQSNSPLPEGSHRNTVALCILSSVFWVLNFEFCILSSIFWVLYSDFYIMFYCLDTDLVLICVLIGYWFLSEFYTFLKDLIMILLYKFRWNICLDIHFIMLFFFGKRFWYYFYSDFYGMFNCLDTHLVLISIYL